MSRAARGQCRLGSPRERACPYTHAHMLCTRIHHYTCCAHPYTHVHRLCTLKHMGTYAVHARLCTPKHVCAQVVHTQTRRHIGCAHPYTEAVHTRTGLHRYRCSAGQNLVPHGAAGAWCQRCDEQRGTSQAVMDSHRCERQTHSLARPEPSKSS